VPLTIGESVGFSMGVLNIWDKYVDVDSMRQLDLLRKQYTDESIIAYLRREEQGMGIRVVNLEDFRDLRKKVTVI
jgi:hypothetical protein|tara:strand:- start:1050 stop:1274 length:225 start_codon:yes stop_codon:yes gene_type:complete